MTKLRSSAAVALSVVFAVVVIVYSFTHRFNPRAVLNPNPAQPSFVYEANNLEELLQSPVCGQLDHALGAGNSLKALAASNPWKKWAAASEIAVADIPFRNAGHSKSWAAASWVGWRSPWLRWKLEQSRNKNLTLLGKHAVWPVWQYDAPDLANGMSLTFALTDNLFLICLSENPSDILLLLDTYDRRTPAYPRGTDS